MFAMRIQPEFGQLSIKPRFPKQSGEGRNTPMTDPSSSYDPRRFRTTVPFYARYRLGYPDALIARVWDIVGLKPGDSVMDLGSGPGLIAIPFAKAGARVVAVDPEPAMLEAAREAVAEAGVALDLRLGSSFDMPADIGPFKLVTMGRSFHWMDREATLRTLDGLVVADGAVALLHDHHPRTAENIWRTKLRELVDRYGRPASEHIAAEAHPEYRRHESLLLDSAFSRVEQCSVFIRREITTDDIVGLALSLSPTSPQKLGDKRQAFEDELRAELAGIAPDGCFREMARLDAVIARRPWSAIG
jgi:SAM-dependent methyltransferase